MKNISDVANTVNLHAFKDAKETQRSLDPKSIDIVNRLFAFFESVCRGFDKQYHSKPQNKLNREKIQWARAFMDSDITKLEDIEFGIKKCRLESPINTPTIGQFLAWCTPTAKDLGLPSVEYAYLEACNNSHASSEKKWTHQAIYHAWSLCDSYELKTLPKNKTFQVFETHYNTVVKMVRRNEPLKEIPTALIEDKSRDNKNCVLKDYENCKSYNSARNAFEKMLGKKIGVKEEPKNTTGGAKSAHL